MLYCQSFIQLWNKFFDESVRWVAMLFQKAMHMYKSAKGKLSQKPILCYIEQSYYFVQFTQNNKETDLVMGWQCVLFRWCHFVLYFHLNVKLFHFGITVINVAYHRLHLNFVFSHINKTTEQIKSGTFYAEYTMKPDVKKPHTFIYPVWNIWQKFAKFHFVINEVHQKHTHS